VTVTLIQINPYKLLASESFVLEKQGDQHTAFSFTCDNDGKITNVDTTKQIPFVFGGASHGPGQDDDPDGSAPGGLPR
jgi:hypothetical protein